MDMQRVVIIGAGQAGLQTAETLRRGGFTGSVTLIGAEAHAPYQRPPLSKAYLSGAEGEERLFFRAEDFYAQNNIDLRLGTTVTAVDAAARRVRLSDGAELAFEHCVFATGGRVRRLTCPGAEAACVLYLRGLDDAQALKHAADNAQRVVIIGAGFIGLEAAAVLTKMGKAVTILEAAPRVLARVVAPAVSAFYHDVHTQAGVAIRTDVQARAIHPRGDGAVSVETAHGDMLDADLVLAGIGVTPETALAREAGLAVDYGIAVDAQGRCSLPGFYAAGDCAQGMNQWLGAATVLESVQNAIDQAKIVAKTILGEPAAYGAVPWFWSDQYDLKLQMAGLSSGAEDVVLRGDTADRSFSAFYFRAGALIAVDSINRPADHMAARLLLQARAPLTPAQAADAAFDLRAAAKAAM